MTKKIIQRNYNEDGSSDSVLSVQTSRIEVKGWTAQTSLLLQIVRLACRPNANMQTPLVPNDGWSNMHCLRATYGVFIGRKQLYKVNNDGLIPKNIYKNAFALLAIVLIVSTDNATTTTTNVNACLQNKAQVKHTVVLSLVWKYRKQCVCLWEKERKFKRHGLSLNLQCKICRGISQLYLLQTLQAIGLTSLDSNSKWQPDFFWWQHTLLIRGDNHSWKGQMHHL